MPAAAPLEAVMYFEFEKLDVYQVSVDFVVVATLASNVMRRQESMARRGRRTGRISRIIFGICPND